MKALSLAAVFVLLHMASYAQITVSGAVTTADRRPVADANVMLQTPDGSGMYGYAISGADGGYSIACTPKSDSILVVVTGFNIRPVRRLVAARTQRADFEVERQELKIREVVVKAQPIRRQNDTLDYNVASYIDSLDRSIGDVMKKMPGIEVSESGEVKVNGTAINRFYVEGLDMMGGRYGLATNNIRARDIASVQVLENHQPIKALKDFQPSDKAAINLKLKESVKGTFNTTLQAGAGYRPAMWNGEATAMYFARTFQTLDTYKTNNEGDDVAAEIGDLFGSAVESSWLGITRPSTPSLDRSRYLRNNVHAVSANVINKWGKDLEINANATYSHDLQSEQGVSTTVYYLPDGNPLRIVENTEAALRSDRAEIDLKLRSNTERRFLTEELRLKGAWSRDRSTVDSIGQLFTSPEMSIENRFQYIRNRKNRSLQFSSRIGYASLPSALDISPTPYPDLFDAEAGTGAVQTLDNGRFSTVNSFYYSWRVGRWDLSVTASAEAQTERIVSSLRPSSAAEAVDSMRNDIRWRRLSGSAGPRIAYRGGNDLRIWLQVPVDFVSISSLDRISGRTARLNRPLLSPVFGMQGNISPDLKYSASAFYGENASRSADDYSGCIMRSYRSISTRESGIARNYNQRYSASLTYSNAISSLFGSVDASYRRTRSNLTYGVTYIGTLSRIEAYPIDNLSHGYDIGAKLSKRFDGIATTVTLTGAYARSFARLWRDGVIMPVRYDLTSAGAAFSTRFGRAVRLDYNAEWGRSESRIDRAGTALKPIDTVTQQAKLGFIIARKIDLTLAGQHFYNGAVSHGDRSMFFADLGLRYRTKRVEYSLDARNLFDTGTFRSASYSDDCSYVYSYRLRPASVMLRVKFSLR